MIEYNMNFVHWFRPYRVIILLLILAALILRIPILKNRGFDPDEFQHLHVTRQLYHGQIPYRDFFEHHTPFIYFTMTGLYAIFGEGIHILFVARGLMLILTVLILYLTYILGKNLYNTDTGLFGALFLSYVIMFLEKTLEVRPDVPAVIFWLAALTFMVKGVKDNSSAFSSKRFILSGLMMGISIMFTQKALFALAGMGLSLIWMLCDRRTGIPFRRSLKLTSIFIGAAAVPMLLTCLFFLVNRGLWQFINCNFIMNSNWKVKFTPYNYIRNLLRQNSFFIIISIFGLIVTTFWIGKRDEVAKGNYMPVLCTYMLIAGLFIMPVPYRQYYQLFLPLLAIYCGLIFSKIAAISPGGLVSSFKKRGLSLLPVILTLIGIVLVGIGLFYTLRMGKPKILNSLRLYLIMWGTLMALAILAFILKKNTYAALFISIGMIAYPLQQTVNQLSARNDGQLASVKYIMEITSEEDTVMDGWSGFGFLRPHAYYYYFLHGEMRAMMSEKERSDDVIESLEKQHTKVIIYDGSVRALSKKVQDYVNANYIPSGHGNIYIRKE